jgi:hypothetical protein
VVMEGQLWVALVCSLAIVHWGGVMDACFRSSHAGLWCDTWPHTNIE